MIESGHPRRPVYAVATREGLARPFRDGTAAWDVARGDGISLADGPSIRSFPDRPGGLWEILKVLEGAGINVEYMYAFVRKSPENAIVIFRFDEPDMEGAVLRAAGSRMMTGDEVQAP